MLKRLKSLAGIGGFSRCFLEQLAGLLAEVTDGMLLIVELAPV
jgi:hypothetical protein